MTVRYRNKKDWRPATAMDISSVGCRLRLGEDLPTGTELLVTLERPGGEGSAPVSVEVGGVVMWSRLEGLSHQAGIQFRGQPRELDDVLRALA